MGGLLIKNNELRCKDCFHLYSFKILPDYPCGKISKTCKCSTSEVEISKFLTDYKKNKNLTIFCSNCKKTNPKEPKYCHNCQKLYCANCIKAVHNEQNNNLDHKSIGIEKYDLFCIQHQNDNFVGYCKTCNIDICAKCIKEQLHNEHKTVIYNKLYDEKKMKDFLKKAMKSAEIKIDYNNKITIMMCKEIKQNELVKQIKVASETNINENKKILEFINILHEIYDSSKTKNYLIIMNAIDNMAFNLERIKFEKNSTKEKDIELLVNYLKTDFVLKTKPKSKEEIPSTLAEQFINNQVEVHTDINKEEAKKEEENKEEHKEEDAKGNDDDILPKTLKDKKDVIEKRMSALGGFKKAESASSNKNDIIKDSTGSPNDVVNLISNQTIIKKNKKKPKKINFQS